MQCSLFDVYDNIMCVCMCVCGTSKDSFCVSGIVEFGHVEELHSKRVQLIRAHLMNSVSVQRSCVWSGKRDGFSICSLFCVRKQWAKRWGRGAQFFWYPEGQHILIRRISLKEGDQRLLSAFNIHEITIIC